MAYKNIRFKHSVEMYDSGLSIQDIANHYCISRQSMHNVLVRRGYTPRSNLKFGEENHFYRGGVLAEDRIHNLTERALEKGILINPRVCENCGEDGLMKDGRTKIQAHHDDYNNPLLVRWLCQKCHHDWHKNNRAIPLIKNEK